MGVAYLLASLPPNADLTAITELLCERGVKNIVLTRCMSCLPFTTNCNCDQPPIEKLVGDDVDVAPDRADDVEIPRMPIGAVDVIIPEGKGETKENNEDERMIHESVHNEEEMHCTAVFPKSFSRELDRQDNSVAEQPMPSANQNQTAFMEAVRVNVIDVDEMVETVVEEQSFHMAEDMTQRQEQEAMAWSELSASSPPHSPPPSPSSFHARGQQREDEEVGAVVCDDIRRSDDVVESVSVNEGDGDDDDLLEAIFPDQPVIVDEEAVRVTKQECKLCKKDVAVFSYGGRGKRTRYVSKTKTLDHLITHMKGLPARFQCSKCARECSRGSAMWKHLRAGCADRGGRAVKSDYTRQQRHAVRSCLHKCFPLINNK